MQRLFAVLLAAALVPLLAGCTLPPGDACDATLLVRSAQGYFATLADPDGGIAPGPGGNPDERTTAWVLLAAGLIRRTGYEGAFIPQPHTEWLEDRLPRMLAEGRGTDSAANNLSLARAALQVWGRSADGIPLADPDHAHVGTLADAWDARYNATNGRYGLRLNEHLFAAFAAWIFSGDAERLDAMAHFTADASTDPLFAGGGDPYAFDAWWAGYARSALGPTPDDTALAHHLEEILDNHTHKGGGVIGFRGGTQPDASTTAAALLGWHAAGEGLDGEHVAPAVAYLCSIHHADGYIPFSADNDHPRAKTTAEATIALSLHIAPVPRPS